ncbi:MAG: GNAT family N-acetyltransferase [Thermoplasmatota archaeon]
METSRQKEMETGIRNMVFVEEQNVDPEIEYDEFEDMGVHFLIMQNGSPVGTVRYRWSGRDIKIERLAVLKEARGAGFGRFAMTELLKIVEGLDPESIYLHSQTSASEFYGKFGFIPEGGVFIEANIEHVKMVLRKDG